MKHSVTSLNVEHYQQHWLHTGDLTWRQSNCYVDLWIEVLHTLSLNPLASFAFTLTSDFEGDQWTFFKVPLHDLSLLYGIDVQELNIWHSVLDHVTMQASRDRLVLLEVDAYYLPDVSDTSYHQAHEKTTIGIQSIDPEAHTLGYFHNSGYYTLQDADFDGIFQAATLPPYAESAKLDQVIQRSTDEQVEIATQLLTRHLANCPTSNPFVAYTEHFQANVSTFRDLEMFHKYAFATMRQYGASYEYASLFLKWLVEYKGEYLQKAAEHFETISGTTQILLLKMARSVKTGKPFDYLSLLGTMQEEWQQGMHLLFSTR